MARPLLRACPIPAAVNATRVWGIALTERCSPPGLSVFYCSLQSATCAELDWAREFDANFVKTNPKFLRGGIVAGLDLSRAAVWNLDKNFTLAYKKPGQWPGFLLNSTQHVLYATLRYINPKRSYSFPKTGASLNTNV
jgi:hypothetical protein